MAKEIDFGSVGDVNCVARIEDPTIGPSVTTDFYVKIKNTHSTDDYDVDIEIMRNPAAGPNVRVEPPGNIGGRHAEKLQIRLTPGQIEDVHFLVKNQEPAGSGVATGFILAVTVTVYDTAGVIVGGPAVNNFSL